MRVSYRAAGWCVFALSLMLPLGWAWHQVVQFGHTIGDNPAESHSKSFVYFSIAAVATCASVLLSLCSVGLGLVDYLRLPKPRTHERMNELVVMSMPIIVLVFILMTALLVYVCLVLPRFFK